MTWPAWRRRMRRHWQYWKMVDSDRPFPFSHYDFAFLDMPYPPKRDRIVNAAVYLRGI